MPATSMFKKESTVFRIIMYLIFFFSKSKENKSPKNVDNDSQIVFYLQPNEILEKLSKIRS